MLPKVSERARTTHATDVLALRPLSKWSTCAVPKEKCRVRVLDLQFSVSASRIPKHVQVQTQFFIFTTMDIPTDSDPLSSPLLPAPKPSDDAPIGQPQRPRSKKTKGKAKTPPPRVKWPNEMVAELLRLRCKDRETRSMIESADTSIKKALAWQHIASVLSQSMGVVVRDLQVSLRSLER